MGMENDTRAFLILIVNTIALVLIWMIANVLVGIYLGYAFYDTTPNWKNVLYYIISIVSFIILVIYLRRKWKL
jgi:ABC-type glycerol-3-phosphate transport system permease component